MTSEIEEWLLNGNTDMLKGKRRDDTVRHVIDVKSEPPFRPGPPPLPALPPPPQEPEYFCLSQITENVLNYKSQTLKIPL